MNLPKGSFSKWWGVVLPIVILIVVDLGLPEDRPWWVGWLCAAISLESYAAGYSCGRSDKRASLGETIRQKDAEIEQKNAEIAREHRRSERLASALEESKRLHRRDIATYEARLRDRSIEARREGTGWWMD